MQTTIERVQQILTAEQLTAIDAAIAGKGDATVSLTVEQVQKLVALDAEPQR